MRRFCSSGAVLGDLCVSTFAWPFWVDVVTLERRGVAAGRADALGAGAGMRCPSCGRHWPDDQRFCGSCGHALDTQAGFREERKVITVLFCDLVGSTARADGSDPEDWAAPRFPDSVIGAISCCELPVQVLVEGLLRGPVPEC